MNDISLVVNSAGPVFPLATPIGVSSVAEAERMLGKAACRQLGIYVVPKGFLLSVVVPVFNERRTIVEVVQRIRGCELPIEIILVDDGSNDGTRELLDSWRDQRDLQIVFHPANRGKGAALRTGFQQSRGDVVIVQDADLEYDPSEFRRLIQPIVEGEADIVFGSRFSGSAQRVLYFWHRVGNWVLTLLSNMTTNLNLSDMETCYKAFRGNLIRDMAPRLRENRFGIEPELTARSARLPGVRIFELPISYRGRTYAEGKKINWRDGVSALRCIWRYRNG